MLNTSCFVRYFLTIILCFAYTLLWADDDIAKKYGCKNLHEIQSGEDALQQLYDNLNTDCFSKIPEIELEKIWGIKVYDFDNPNGITKNMNNEELSRWFDRNIQGKMAKELKANFERDSDKNVRKSIEIYEMDFDSRRLILIDYNDRFPKILPNPLVECDENKIITGTFFGKMIVPSKQVNYGVYSPLCNYFWKGKKNKLEINIAYPAIDKLKILSNDIVVNGYFKSFTFLINAM